LAPAALLAAILSVCTLTLAASAEGDALMLKHARPYPNNLEQLRRQAKELLGAWRSGSTQALSRLVEQRPRVRSDSGIDASELALSEAQFVIARECGFPSWAKLKGHLELGRTIRDPRDYAMFSWRHDGYYAREAEELLDAHGRRLRWAAAWLREHHPDFAGLGEDDTFAAALTIDGARLAIAREVGFDRWEALSTRARLLGHEDPDAADPAARDALSAVEDGDADALDAVLRRDPTVVYATVRDNNTLLEIATDVGDVPSDTRARMMRALIRHGAPPAKALWTNDPEARDLLIDAGALEAGDAPALVALTSNLMHADATTAADDWLARGIEPVWFWMAAAAGDVKRLRRYFSDDGGLTAEAADHRPNLADVGWWEQTGRSDDPREILGEALCMAAMHCRVDAMTFLLDRGADATFAPPGLGGWRPLDFAAYGAFPNRTPSRAEGVRLLLDRGAKLNQPDAHWAVTPLTWATWRGNQALARELLERGSKPDNVTTWGTTALHYAVQHGELELARALLDAGAALDVRDNENDGTPLDWVGGFGGSDEMRDLLTE